MSSQTPTVFEQQMLEYINRARLDPSGEFDALIANADTGTGVQSNITSALSYFGVNLDLFRAQLAAYDAVAPLAWNSALAEAAEGHSQLMIDTQTQEHQIGDEPVLRDRVVAAGYAGWSRLRENIFAYADDPLHGHASFYVDWGAGPGGMQDPAGHRESILAASVTEIGIGALASSGGKVGPYVVTQDFGNRAAYQAQLLGVVIDDADGDDFYDMGEGLGGITVTATGAAGTYVTTSWAAGGYQMVLPDGVYEVSFSGAGISGELSYSVTMEGANLKLDAIADEAVAGDLISSATLLQGTPADELLQGLGEIDQTLIGGGGFDTLLGGGGDDLLFGDQAFEGPAEGDTVYRLYLATLDRAPNLEGYGNWSARLESGAKTLEEVASGFTDSAEFQKTYGALDNEGFVTLLYNNVLDRAPDATGLANWTARLDNGSWSRPEVVLGFSQSAEFIAKTAMDAAAYGIHHALSEGGAASWGDDVFRLYQATLDRAPDVTGFDNWSGRLADGRAYLGVVDGFVQSAEFQKTYGALDNGAFVDLLYNNVLGRDADATGLANWTARLDGGMSRSEVVQGFAQSAEFIAGTEADYEAWMRGQGIDDVLDGGTGDDVLVGGLHADLFLFASGGSATIADFEAWDTLRLEGFGFADTAAARAAFVQDGDDLLLTAGGSDLVLLGTDLDLMTGVRLELA
ncbi:DUF4214 domain-containing protein [Salipiger mangrovisoli]|uniref:DUF4214 domain-containing protein n=1 Tax=Salipiger mangrovisoli TaxID=2865933 RepID=A0ABR9X9V5_9RHOB|nr:DUF4214 domain-containing protein [Salipiger mangrovisoli]MBE9640235.1 DUF4214 domain-containing protein [Salipiger mangrovisoli]